METFQKLNQPTKFPQFYIKHLLLTLKRINKLNKTHAAHLILNLQHRKILL